MAEPTQKPAGEKYTSRCLACKQDVTYDVTFKGVVTTKNNINRYAVKGICPNNPKHRMSTYVKNPDKKETEKPEKKIKKRKREDQEEQEEKEEKQ